MKAVQPEVRSFLGRVWCGRLLTSERATCAISSYPELVLPPHDQRAGEWFKPDGIAKNTGMHAPVRSMRPTAVEKGDLARKGADAGCTADWKVAFIVW
jgi:hypothetical protein